MRKLVLHNRVIALLNKLNQKFNWNQAMPARPDDDLFSNLFTVVF